MQLDDERRKRGVAVASDLSAIAMAWSHRRVGNTRLMLKGVASAGPARAGVIVRTASHANDCMSMLGAIPGTLPARFLHWDVGHMQERLAGFRGPLAVDHDVMAGAIHEVTGALHRALARIEELERRLKGV